MLFRSIFSNKYPLPGDGELHVPHSFCSPPQKQKEDQYLYSNGGGGEDERIACGMKKNEEDRSKVHTWRQVLGQWACSCRKVLSSSSHFRRARRSSREGCCHAEASSLSTAAYAARRCAPRGGIKRSTLQGHKKESMRVYYRFPSSFSSLPEKSALVYYGCLSTWTEPLPSFSFLSSSTVPYSPPHEPPSITTSSDNPHILFPSSSSFSSPLSSSPVLPSLLSAPYTRWNCRRRPSLGCTTLASPFLDKISEKTCEKRKKSDTVDAQDKSNEAEKWKEEEKGEKIIKPELYRPLHIIPAPTRPISTYCPSLRELHHIFGSAIRQWGSGDSVDEEHVKTKDESATDNAIALNGGPPEIALVKKRWEKKKEEGHIDASTTLLDRLKLEVDQQASQWAHPSATLSFHSSNGNKCCYGTTETRYVHASHVPETPSSYSSRGELQLSESLSSALPSPLFSFSTYSSFPFGAPNDQGNHSQCECCSYHHHLSPSPSTYEDQFRRSIRLCYHDTLRVLCNEKVTSLVKKKYQTIKNAKTRFISESLQRQVLRQLIKRGVQPSSRRCENTEAVGVAKSPFSFSSEEKLTTTSTTLVPHPLTDHLTMQEGSSLLNIISGEGKEKEYGGTSSVGNIPKVMCSGVLRHIREGIPAPISFLTFDANDVQWLREQRENARSSTAATQPSALHLGGMCLTHGQLSSLLTPGEWLNDQVINAYLDLLARHARPMSQSMEREGKARGCRRGGWKQMETKDLAKQEGKEKQEEEEEELEEKDREVASLGTHFYAKVVLELEKGSDAVAGLSRGKWDGSSDAGGREWTYQEHEPTKMSLKMKREKKDKEGSTLLPSRMMTGNREGTFWNRSACYKREDRSCKEKTLCRLSSSSSSSLSPSSCAQSSSPILPPLSPTSALLRWFRRRQYLLLPYRAPPPCHSDSTQEETEMQNKEMYSSVRLVLIPVNLSNVHWVLVVWDKEEHELVLYDSLLKDPSSSTTARHYHVLRCLRHVLQECFLHFFGSSRRTDARMEKGFPSCTRGRDEDATHMGIRMREGIMNGKRERGSTQEKIKGYVPAHLQNSIHLHPHMHSHYGPDPPSLFSSVWDIPSHNLYVAFPSTLSSLHPSLAHEHLPSEISKRSASGHDFSPLFSSSFSTTSLYSREVRQRSDHCTSLDDKNNKEKHTIPTSWADLPSHWCAPQQRNGSDCGVFVCLVAWCRTQGVALSFPTGSSSIAFLRSVMGMELWCNKLLIRLISCGKEGDKKKNMTHEDEESTTLHNGDHEPKEKMIIFSKCRELRRREEDNILQELSQEMSSSREQIIGL